MKVIKIQWTMWRVIALGLMLAFSAMTATSQNKGTFKDPRDGYVYQWMKVGNLAWMTENLRFNVAAGSWVYNNDTAIGAKFGRLYNWKAAQTSCPKGWRLSTDKDWNALIAALGGNTQAGAAIQAMDTVGKGQKYGNPAQPATISTLLGGIRHADGSCLGVNTWGGCWTSGKVNDSVANNVLFAHGSREVVFSTNDKSTGFLVRCVRVK
jgi:uncharacterized protein (TIGR02145 family)